MKYIDFTLIKNNNNLTIVCKGNWSVNTIEYIEKKLYNIKCNKNSVLIDLTNITNLDSNGAILLIYLKKELIKKRCNVEFKIDNQNHKKLLEIISDSIKEDNIAPKKDNFIKIIGKKSYDTYRAILEFITFLGNFVIKSLGLFKAKNFRYKEIFYFIYSAGIQAVPIVALTSFLVGVVIAYQTIVQLTKFGADIFVVDASVISITRELAPMITAIVVAGRSASSFSAEIGAMKLTQEIDAMQTMGFKPFYFLIIPRVIALIIVMPILIFIADIFGIFGSMVATKAQIGLTFEIFINRVYEVLALKHYIIGIIKGPFFAIIVALIGSFHGLRVTQNTESIGKETTSSVVNAIFLVIVLDALFSVIFTRFNL